MHVEIDHRDASRAMASGVQGGDRRIVEKAKAHGAFGLGVMSRRTGGDEGVLRLALVNGVDSRDGPSGAAQRRL